MPTPHLSLPRPAEAVADPSVLAASRMPVARTTPCAATPAHGATCCRAPTT